MVRVLVACEFSGVVRDAFRIRGHDAISCDLRPSRKHGPHIIGDVLDVLDQGWDMMVAFPPCDHLSKVGARWWPEKREQQQAAIAFFMALYDAPVPRVAVENPKGVMSTVFRKPDQYVQPWQFGDPYAKLTGLWLRGLPPLVPTVPYEPDNVVPWVSADNRPGRNGLHRLQKVRGLTFHWMAQAMAEQWGEVIPNGTPTEVQPGAA